MTSLSSIKSNDWQGLPAEEVADLYNHLNKNRWQYFARVLQSKESLYIRPSESGLSRAFHMDLKGRVFVHLNRKKMGDFSFPLGVQKVPTFAYELSTFKPYVSTGYKEVNPKEFECLSAFKGVPGFVQLVDWFKYPKNEEIKYRAVFEYCNQGDLYEAIRYLIPSERKEIFIDLVKNLALMHKKGFLHRDLRTENIFLHQEDNGLLKPLIGDFGSACRQDDLEARSKEHPIHGPSASPEHLLARHQRDPNVLLETNTVALDSWALGVTLAELLQMEESLPWPVEDRDEAVAILVNIKGQWFPEPLKKNSPQHLVWELLQNRLPATEAEKRLRDIDWSSFCSE